MCGWCSLRIEAGSAANYAAGVFEGDFFTSYMHPECAAAEASRSWEERADGFMPGENARGRTDDDFEGPPQFSADYRGGKPAKLETAK